MKVRVASHFLKKMFSVPLQSSAKYHAEDVNKIEHNCSAWMHLKMTVCKACLVTFPQGSQKIIYGSSVNVSGSSSYHSATPFLFTP